MPVTMKDVAKKANLAVGTVSNYINGKESVKQRNREKIEEAIIALGYEVNEVARNLKKQSSKTIGVIIPSFSNVFAVKIVSNLESIFRKSGYALQVFSFSNEIETLDQIINSLIAKCVEGLIIMPSNALQESEIERINSLIDRKIPVVVFDSTDEGMKCDHIVLNNYEKMKRVTNMLLNMGHKKIALFLGPADISSSKERLDAFIDAHKENASKVDGRYIIHTDYTKSDSRSKCKKLLLDNDEISAVMTAGYRITLGVLAAINESESKILDDISVIGFDILDISDIFKEHLTGVFIPTDEVAEAIAEVIIKRIDNGFKEESYRKVVKLGFIEGNSVRKIV